MSLWSHLRVLSLAYVAWWSLQKIWFHSDLNEVAKALCWSYITLTSTSTFCIKLFPIFTISSFNGFDTLTAFCHLGVTLGLWCYAKPAALCRIVRSVWVIHSGAALRSQLYDAVKLMPELTLMNVFWAKQMMLTVCKKCCLVKANIKRGKNI